MEVIHVKGNTFFIDTGMTYIPFYKVNDNEIIMLDSGWSRGERQEIDKILEMNNFRIIGIICSHAHIDHVGNIAYFKEKYNCVIAMSAYEAFFCSSTVNLKVYYSSHTLTGVTEHYGHMVCETDIKILDNEESVNIRGVEFKVLHTPGHSPAHICIITPDNVAYLGDSLISYEVMAGAKLPYAFILTEDLKSKKKLYDLNCSNYIVAHKGMYNDITDLIADNINFYTSRAKRVYNVIDKPMTMEEIMRAIIKKWNINVKTKYKYAMVERMLKSYVEYLNETGKLELNIEDGFLKYQKVNREDEKIK